MFVTFEGIDGSGKSTQARRLAEALRGLGREVVETREPGGTELGERIRGLLLGDGTIAAPAEAALFAAARAQLVDEVVLPARSRGADVVCDRFVDSSLVYQGVARGLGIDAVLALNEQALGGVLPDVTFVLVLPVDEALGRSTGRRDRIEAEGRGFLERVAEGYRELAVAFPERIVVVDASQAPASVAATILDQVVARLEALSHPSRRFPALGGELTVPG
ncbi:MAG: dTMP kinase [Gaiellales bacterium]